MAYINNIKTYFRRQRFAAAKFTEEEKAELVRQAIAQGRIIKCPTEYAYGARPSEIDKLGMKLWGM